MAAYWLWTPLKQPLVTSGLLERIKMFSFWQQFLWRCNNIRFAKKKKSCIFRFCFLPVSSACPGVEETRWGARGNKWPAASSPAAPDLPNLLLVHKLIVTCICVVVEFRFIFSLSCDWIRSPGSVSPLHVNSLTAIERKNWTALFFFSPSSRLSFAFRVPTKLHASLSLLETWLIRRNL